MFTKLSQGMSASATALTVCCCQELELIPEDSAVYKLVGPVLIKQDQFEAKSNVQKRLDFISSEMTSLDSQMKGLEEKRSRKQQQVSNIDQAGLYDCIIMVLTWGLADHEDAAGDRAAAATDCLKM